MEDLRRRGREREEIDVAFESSAFLSSCSLKKSFSSGNVTTTREKTNSKFAVDKANFSVAASLFFTFDSFVNREQNANDWRSEVIRSATGVRKPTREREREKRSENSKWVCTQDSFLPMVIDVSWPLAGTDYPWTINSIIRHRLCTVLDHRTTLTTPVKRFYRRLSRWMLIRMDIDRTVGTISPIIISFLPSGNWRESSLHSRRRISKQPVIWFIYSTNKGQRIKIELQRKVNVR